MNIGLQVSKRADGATFTLYQAVFMPDLLPSGAQPFETGIFARNPDDARVIGEFVARTGPQHRPGWG